MNEAPSSSSSKTGGPQSFENFVRQIPRLREFASDFLHAYLLKLSSSLKQNLFRTIFWIFAVILLFQVTYLALFMLLQGAGEGLGIYLGNQGWLGNVVVGAALLLMILVVAKLGLIVLNHSAVKKSREADLTERKIHQALVRIQEDLKGIFQIQDWVDRYPLPTTGAVAILGFWVGGNLVHETHDETSPAYQALLGSQSSKSRRLTSLTELLLLTCSDILKDGAHLWLQKTLETTPHSGISEKSENSDTSQGLV